jgi:hypothetical protein
MVGSDLERCDTAEDLAEYQGPNEVFSVGRKGVRKITDDPKSSFRIPRRLPSRSGNCSHQSTGGGSSKGGNSVRFFSVKKRQSVTAHTSGSGSNSNKTYGDPFPGSNDAGLRRIVPQEPSGLDIGATEAMSENDDAFYVLENLPPELFSKIELLEDFNQMEGTRRGSLQLQQVFGGGSRRSGSGSHRQFSGWGTSSRGCKAGGQQSTGTGNSGSFLSSISSAFSSVRGAFVFTTTNSDRHLADLDGQSLPHFGDENVGSFLHRDDVNESCYHNYHEDDPHIMPPRQPSRRLSFQSGSHRSNFVVESRPSLPYPASRSSGAGTNVSGKDGVPRRPGRCGSLAGSIECGSAVDKEVDVSCSFHLGDGDSGGVTDADTARQPNRLIGANGERLELVSGKNSSRSERRFHTSVPLPGIAPFEGDNHNQAKSPRRQSAPARPNRFGSSPGSTPLSSAEELPFPIRRESIHTVTSQSSKSGSLSVSRRRLLRGLTTTPSSVPPEATTLEKKSFLKSVLHFPKQRLSHVLSGVPMKRNQHEGTSSNGSSAS